MSVNVSEPEILPPGATPRDQMKPRMGGAGGAFRDENLDLLSKVLDTWFRIPGTDIRFGMDGIIGFIPGIGDLLAGLASTIIVVAAYFRGVPMVTLTRMVANIGVEVGIGVVPFFGNLFDIAWRANRRNYHLLERSLEAPNRDTWKDWIFMVLFGLALMTLIMLPFMLALWVGGSLLHKMSAPGWH
jgi:hypothetical protein